MKRLIFSITAIILACFIQTSVAQNNFYKVDNWLAANTPAMGGRSVLMIYKDGKVVYSNTVNKMSLQQKYITKQMAERQGITANLQDYTTTTKLRFASCSKWLSAALVMTFVDEGKLSLSDTVGRFLPVLTRHGKGNITISECLSHTTGIEAPPLRESLTEMRDVNSMDEAIEKIAELPMEGEPGKVFHYSNAGLQIAGAVIEKVSGKSFENLFKERIAEPLQMLQTDFGNGKVALPAGGAWSTAEDYLHFLAMILHKGEYNGKRVLSEKSVDAMEVNQLLPGIKIAYSPTEAGNFGYGLGEWVMETSTNDNLSQAVTSPGLFGSFPWVDNKHNYCAVLVTFYVNNARRHERYISLKALVDEALK